MIKFTLLKVVQTYTLKTLLSREEKLGKDFNAIRAVLVPEENSPDLVKTNIIFYDKAAGFSLIVNEVGPSENECELLIITLDCKSYISRKMFKEGTVFFKRA